jgi:hypothetical protein
MPTIGNSSDGMTERVTSGGSTEGSGALLLVMSDDHNYTLIRCFAEEIRVRES